MATKRRSSRSCRRGGASSGGGSGASWYFGTAVETARTHVSEMKWRVEWIVFSRRSGQIRMLDTLMSAEASERSGLLASVPQCPTSRKSEVAQSHNLIATVASA